MLFLRQKRKSGDKWYRSKTNGILKQMWQFWNCHVVTRNGSDLFVKNFNPQNTSNIFSILQEPIAFVSLQAWLTHPIPRRCLSWSTENGFQFDDLVIWHLNCTRNMSILAALPFGQLIFHLTIQPKSKGEVSPTSSNPKVKPGIRWSRLSL